MQNKTIINVLHVLEAMNIGKPVDQRLWNTLPEEVQLALSQKNELALKQLLNCDYGVQAGHADPDEPKVVNHSSVRENVA